MGAQPGIFMTNLLKPPIIWYGAGVLVVIAVLLLVVAVARVLGGRVRGRRGSRLGISEYREIDKQRRLVLVRRDGVEHLLLIGGNEDLVVETGITGEAAGQRARRRVPARADEDGEGPSEPTLAPARPRPSPRPPVFGDHTPTLRAVEREPTQAAGGEKGRESE